MVNISKLRGRIVERGFTVEELAKETKIERSKLYRRLLGNGKDFTIEEASAISKALKLNGKDVNEIFFCKNNRINATCVSNAKA